MLTEHQINKAAKIISTGDNILCPRWASLITQSDKKKGKHNELSILVTKKKTKKVMDSENIIHQNMLFPHY